jgi:hypothetical protein
VVAGIVVDGVAVVIGCVGVVTVGITFVLFVVVGSVVVSDTAVVVTVNFFSGIYPL